MKGHIDFIEHLKTFICFRIVFLKHLNGVYIYMYLYIYIDISTRVPITHIHAHMWFP